MKLTAGLLFALFIAAAITALWAAAAREPSSQSSPELTAERLREPGWWPTKRDSIRKNYAGSDACAQCHEREVLAQRQTSMARAASKAFDTDVLRSNPKLSLNSPPFLTDIRRDRNGSTYTVARGGEAISGQIVWTMGDGILGQTFVVEAAGNLFESQLSYFPSIGGLDLTPGHTSAGSRDLENAFGQRQSEATAQQCFACHTTASSIRGQFDPSHAMPGVTCEACHGPGSAHVNAMRQNQIQEGKSAVLNPAAFDPVKLIDYCGACHRAPRDVAAAKDYVPINVRFQPYRLAKSGCWSRPDRRIDCVACHNPHEQVERDASFYDAKCLACHSLKTTNPPDVGHGDPAEIAATNKLPACPVASSHCASCHMPKYKVPQMHGSFTDHDIRIVHTGDPYPL